MLERKGANQTNCEKGCTRPGSQPRETHTVRSPSLEIDIHFTRKCEHFQLWCDVGNK